MTEEIVNYRNFDFEPSCLALFQKLVEEKRVKDFFETRGMKIFPRVR